MSSDSHFSYVHKPDRFVDVVDDEWVTHQLPAETLFANVSEFDDEDEELDKSDDDADFRWNDLNLAPFLASAPPAPPNAAAAAAAATNQK